MAEIRDGARTSAMPCFLRGCLTEVQLRLDDYELGNYELQGREKIGSANGSNRARLFLTIDPLNCQVWTWSSTTDCELEVTRLSIC